MISKRVRPVNASVTVTRPSSNVLRLDALGVPVVGPLEAIAGPVRACPASVATRPGSVCAASNLYLSLDERGQLLISSPIAKKVYTSVNLLAWRSSMTYMS